MSITILSPEDSRKILLRWKKEGPTEKELEEFITTALGQLTNGDRTKAFANNISQIAQIAAEIDKTFVDVEKILWVVVYLAWPIGIPLLQQWISFKDVNSSPTL